MRWTALGMLLFSTCHKDSPPEPSPPERARITLADNGILLGAERTAPRPRDALEKVDALFASLESRRKVWRAAHPDELWPGGADVELDAGITCLEAMSVIASVAFAGYPELSIRVGPARLDMRYDLPSPMGCFESPPGHVDAHLGFHRDGSADLRPSRCLGAFDTVAAAGLAPAVVEYSGKPEHLHIVAVACEPGIAFRDVHAALVAIHAAAPRASFSAGHFCDGGEPTSVSALDLPWPIPALSEAAGAGWPVPAPPTSRAPPRGPSPRLEVRIAEPRVTGALAPEAVQRFVEGNAPALRACYEDGVQKDPKLEGRIELLIKIGKKGGVMGVGNAGSNMPDYTVVRCVRSVFTGLTFPAPEHGAATVVVPMFFRLK
jgi:hypothetical protein